jgi:hypothetical protein
MESSASLNQAGGQGRHESPGAWDSDYALAADGQHMPGKPHRGIGALATSMRDLVRDTVYVTFDALRGRYDR